MALILPPPLKADEITLSGTISTLAGEPVAGAEVYLYAGSNTRKPADFISPKSSPAGTYRMSVPRANYLAIARVKKGERYGPLMPGDRHSGEPVKIVPDEEAQITQDFVVADMQELAQRREKEREELAEVTGTILTATPASVPLYVYARTAQTTVALPDYFSAWADAEGHYSLRLPPGRYFLGTATEFPPTPTTVPLREVVVTAGKLPVAIDLHYPLQ